ncbi:hypothetical protein [Flavobacterium phragmitis]|uniref:Uncharacterized protein n=1 Tax=Flavobacterium phragmitis TaxID=739143 RepID=A0A1I1W3Z6_9FLAO|nr:hypothetical protein [Flavobacterium phragmitis]SFD89098.1 hypothetical protein SAMN05216297_11430 [Flavobacterium phragmitis]
MNTFYNKIALAVTLIFTCFSLQSCLVNRCKRPQITGYIYDSETKLPIANCKVGETLNLQNGYFSLNEKRYHQFTFFGFEAPTLMVNEPIKKEGYESQQIHFMQPFGGGMKKGALHKMDTLYLKKTLIK